MSVTIKYHGHATFELTDGETTVLVDPWFTGNPAAVVSAGDVNAETILVTHAHTDHVGDTLAIATRTGATVITVNELANYFAAKGVENAVGGNHGGTIQFNGGSAKFTPAWHSSVYEDENGIVAPGVPAGFIVRYGGVTIYFAGDTALFGDMALIGEEGIDVAVLPIGDKFTMGPDDAVRAAKLIGARVVIPAHFNTFPAIAQDADAFATNVRTKTKSRVEVLKPGDSFTIEAQNVFV
jgi:L-ascorbate metabolism protein UlaG (beta-lactamase superfamily)